MLIRKCVSLFVIVAAACQSCELGIAKDIVVDGMLRSSTPTRFKTIAEALAVAEDGDQVLIRALNDRGMQLIYNEQNLIVDKSINISSYEGYNENPVRAIIRGQFPIHLDNYDPDNPAHVEHARAQQSINWPQQKPVLRIAADDVHVSWLEIQGASKTGIHVQSLDPDTRLINVSVRKCHTFMTFSSGIYFNRVTGAEISDCFVRRACQYGWQECITLHDVDWFVVKNNLVYDRPYLRIPFDIPANENSEIVKVNGKAVIRGGEGIDAKSGSSIGIINQNIVASINKFGIYVDGYDKESHTIHIYNNFVFNTGCGISIASENNGFTHDIQVYGNIVALSQCGLYINDHGLGTTHDVSNIDVHHNTFFANRAGGIVISNRDLIGLTLTNNISINNAGTDIKLDRECGNFIQFENNIYSVAKYDGTLIHPGFNDPIRQFKFAENNIELKPGEVVLNADFDWDPSIWEVPWEQRIGLPYFWISNLYVPTDDSIAIKNAIKSLGNFLSDKDIFGTKIPAEVDQREIGAVER